MNDQVDTGGPVLTRIAERVMNRPLLIHPDKGAIILQVLSGRLPIDARLPEPQEPFADRFRGSRKREDGHYGLSNAVNGTAIISIVGSLVNRGGWIGANSGLVSYEGISAQLRDAANDHEISHIILDIDSGGGEALGMSALAKQVREINQIKPVIAVVNDMAASAAYGIASGATRIVVSETSLTGSIGVVLMHSDHSAKLANEGVAVTLIHAGAHKVDGHPFGPLTDAVRANLQAEVAKHYSLFLQTVAEGRGSRLSVDEARATEARVFIGADAIEVGLADQVASLSEVLDDLKTTARSRAITPKRGLEMSNENNTDPEAGITQSQLDAATGDARRAGATEERARIAAIINCDEATERRSQAITMALKTDLTAETAAELLASSPKEGAGVQTIEDRAKDGTEMGGTDTPPEAAAVADAAWGKALSGINKH